MLGTRIREHIHERGLKFGAIADKAGISTNVFSAMLNEKRKITAEEYFDICRALNVPLNEFCQKKTDEIPTT